MQDRQSFMVWGRTLRLISDTMHSNANILFV